MRLKTGRLANDERQIILDNPKATDDELAKRLNRRPEAIRAFRDTSLSLVNDTEDEVMLTELRTKVYWTPITQQFDKMEVEMFQRYWVELYKQFNQDVEFSEEMQIVDLVKLRLLTERNLIERNKSKAEIELVQKEIDKFIEENGPQPYEDPMVTARFISLNTQIRMCETSYMARTNEYKTLLDKQQAYFDELKATRKHRIEILKNTKKDWVALMKELMDEKKRNKEGRELELMNLAAQKELEKLSDWHIYSDGTADIPLLNNETIKAKDASMEGNE